MWCSRSPCEKNTNGVNVSLNLPQKLILVPEDVVVLGEALLECGAIDAAVQDLFLAHLAVCRRVSVAYVHLE